MNLLGKLLNGASDLLLWPVRWSRPLALAWCGVLAGVLLLWLFKLVTPQQRLAAARQRVTGLILELGLWQDDLRTMLGIQRELAMANLRYLAASLPSLLVLLPVFVIVVLQLEARFGYRSPRPGEVLLVTATLAPDATATAVDSLRLSTGPGLAVTAGPVRDRSRQQVWWRVQATDTAATTTAGTDQTGHRALALTVHLADRSWSQRLATDHPLGGLSPVRERSTWRAALLQPGVPALPPEAPLERLAVTLPRASGYWLGLPTWLWGFVLVSLVAGLLVKNILRVEI